MPAESKKYLDTQELADRWGVSKMTIRREIKRGRLKRTLISSSVRFAVKEIERYELVSQGG